MRNYNSKFKNFFHEEEITEKFKKIYPSGKGEDSAGGFRLERTGKINSRTLSKNFWKIKTTWR